MTPQDEPATTLANVPPHPFAFSELEMAEMYSAAFAGGGEPACKAWLMSIIHAVPELQDMWNQLHRPVDGGLSLIDLALLVFRMGPADRYPECERTLNWVFGLQEHTREVRDRLRMAEDLDPESLSCYWAMEAVQYHQLIDRLRVEGWTDPAEILDPRRHRDVAYEHLFAVCNSRLRQAADPKERTQLLEIRRRLALFLELERTVPSLEERFVETFTKRGFPTKAPQGEQRTAEGFVDWFESLLHDLRQSLGGEVQ